VDGPVVQPASASPPSIATASLRIFQSPCLWRLQRYSNDFAAWLLNGSAAG
jgi:hypothetical protein